MSDKPISEMTKNELVKFAKEKLSLDLDAFKKVAVLRDEVATLYALKLDDRAGVNEQALLAPSRKDHPSHLKHPTNHRVFQFTEHLASRGDMLPCNAKGTLVASEDDE